MAEVINPAIVPKVTLPSGEQVPCVGRRASISSITKKPVSSRMAAAAEIALALCRVSSEDRDQAFIR